MEASVCLFVLCDCTDVELLRLTSILIRFLNEVISTDDEYGFRYWKKKRYSSLTPNTMPKFDGKYSNTECKVQRR